MSELVIIDQEDEEPVPADLDTSNPRSLVNVVPGFFRMEILRLQQSYFELSTYELEHKLFSYAGSFGLADKQSSQLRIQFWDEYDRCQRWQERMKADNICMGLGSVIWLRRWIQNKTRLAWLIRVPDSYNHALADIHRLSIQQMRKIMALDSTSNTTKPNTKLMEVQFKIAQHVDQRVKGSVIQQVNQRNVNINQITNAALPASEEEKPAAISMEEIEDQIAKLKQKSQQLSAPAGVQVDLLASITAKPAEPAIIDVDASDDTQEQTR